jgi:hypothetical protein
LRPQVDDEQNCSFRLKVVLKPGVDVQACTPIADAASLVDADVMSEDNFSWLSRWYLSHCDDEWEHAYGVRIDTLDNPGWSLKIDLTATSLQDKAFERVTQGEPSDDLKGWHRTGSWWIASVQNGQFEAFCGPLDLSAAIGVFRRWADETAKH